MNTNLETILGNLTNAVQRLMALRMIVSSPHEKIADVPVVYAIIALLLCAPVCVLTAVLGFLFKYSVRFEMDAMKM